MNAAQEDICSFWAGGSSWAAVGAVMAGGCGVTKIPCSMLNDIDGSACGREGQCRSPGSHRRLRAGGSSWPQRVRDKLPMRNAQSGTPVAAVRLPFCLAAPSCSRPSPPCPPACPSVFCPPASGPLCAPPGLRTTFDVTHQE
jgi:hypothetical protein